MAAPGGLSAPAPPRGHAATAIRPFRMADLPAVAALRRRAFARSERTRPGALEAYLERMFLGHPFAEAGIASLVAEDAAGRVVGFQGVVPARMWYGARPLIAAVGTQLMVAPEARGLTGRALVRALFDGPQDLTLSDVANDAARRLWEGLGGAPVPWLAESWTLALRPWRHRANRRVIAGAGRLARAALYGARPALAVADRLAARPATLPAGLRFAPLDADAMAAAADRLLGDYPLRPRYDAAELRWRLHQAAEKREFGALEGAMVLGEEGVTGWFLYYRNDAGECEVVQGVAARRDEATLLEALAAHAWARGGVALTGRLGPSLLGPLAARRATLCHEGPSVVCQSRDAAIRGAVARGELWLSRLDGEWWMSF